MKNFQTKMKLRSASEESEETIYTSSMGIWSPSKVGVWTSIDFLVEDVIIQSTSNSVGGSSSGSYQPQSIQSETTTDENVKFKPNIVSMSVDNLKNTENSTSQPLNPTLTSRPECRPSNGKDRDFEPYFNPNSDVTCSSEVISDDFKYPDAQEFEYNVNTLLDEKTPPESSPRVVYSNRINNLSKFDRRCEANISQEIETYPSSLSTDIETFGHSSMSQSLSMPSGETSIFQNKCNIANPRYKRLSNGTSGSPRTSSLDRYKNIYPDEKNLDYNSISGKPISSIGNGSTIDHIPASSSSLFTPTGTLNYPQLQRLSNNFRYEQRPPVGTTSMTARSATYSPRQRSIINGRRINSFDSFNDGSTISSQSFVCEYDSFVDNQQKNAAGPSSSSNPPNNRVFSQSSDIIGQNRRNFIRNSPFSNNFVVGTDTAFDYVDVNCQDLGYFSSSISVDDLCSSLHSSCNLHHNIQDSSHAGPVCVNQNVTYTNSFSDSYPSFSMMDYPEKFSQPSSSSTFRGSQPSGRMSGSRIRSIHPRLMNGHMGAEYFYDYSLANHNKVVSSPGPVFRSQYNDYTHSGMRNGHFNIPSISTSTPTIQSISMPPTFARDRLLDEFRSSPVVFASNRPPSQIIGHVVSFSRDQHGSRYVQQIIDIASPELLEAIFNEILLDVSLLAFLITDLFGNYVIQKLLERGSREQLTRLMYALQGSFLNFSMHMYGCRVVQKAIEHPENFLKTFIIQELDGNVNTCIKDQNGNHVIQKCIEQMKNFDLEFIINAFRGNVCSLSIHSYGCRVIQRLMEYCHESKISFIADELMNDLPKLVKDQYGNYVIQHIIEKFVFQDSVRIDIIQLVINDIFELSTHKFASNVVEKCFTNSSESEIEEIVKRLTEISPHGTREDLLFAMMKDQYGNYVIQKILERCESTDLIKDLLLKIHPYYTELKKHNYSKHLVPKLDAMFPKYNISAVNDDCVFESTTTTPPARASSSGGLKSEECFSLDESEYMKEFPLYLASSASKKPGTLSSVVNGTVESSIRTTKEHSRVTQRRSGEIISNKTVSISAVNTRRGKAPVGKQKK